MGRDEIMAMAGKYYVKKDDISVTLLYVERVDFNHSERYTALSSVMELSYRSVDSCAPHRVDLIADEWYDPEKIEEYYDECPAEERDMILGKVREFTDGKYPVKRGTEVKNVFSVIEVDTRDGKVTDVILLGVYGSREEAVQRKDKFKKAFANDVIGSLVTDTETVAEIEEYFDDDTKGMMRFEVKEGLYGI